MSDAVGVRSPYRLPDHNIVTILVRSASSLILTSQYCAAFDYRSTPRCHRAQPTSRLSLADSLHTRSLYPVQTFILTCSIASVPGTSAKYSQYCHNIVVTRISVHRTVTSSLSCGPQSTPDHSNLCLPSAVRPTSTPCAFRDSRFYALGVTR